MRASRGSIILACVIVPSDLMIMLPAFSLPDPWREAMVILTSRVSTLGCKSCSIVLSIVTENYNYLSIKVSVERNLASTNNMAYNTKLKGKVKFLDVVTYAVVFFICEMGGR